MVAGCGLVDHDGPPGVGAEGVNYSEPLPTAHGKGHGQHGLLGPGVLENGGASWRGGRGGSPSGPSGLCCGRSIPLTVTPTAVPALQLQTMRLSHITLVTRHPQTLIVLLKALTAPTRDSTVLILLLPRASLMWHQELPPPHQSPVPAHPVRVLTLHRFGVPGVVHAPPSSSKLQFLASAS